MTLQKEAGIHTYFLFKNTMWRGGNLGEEKKGGGKRYSEEVN